MPLSPTLPQRFSQKQFISFAVFFAVYFVAAVIGGYFYKNGHTFPGLIWPAAGISVAGLYLGGRWLWPAVALGSFLASMTNGIQVLPALLIMLAQTGQSLLSAQLLHIFNFNPLINRLRDALLIAFIAFVPTVIVPAVAAFSRIYISQTSLPSDFLSLWGPYWVGYIASLMIVFPLVVRWIVRPLFYRNARELIEIALALIAVASINIIIFWFGIAQFIGVPLVYVLLFPYFWAALRIGPRFMTIALFIGAFIGVVSTLYAGHVPNIGTGLLNTEEFVTVIAFIFLVLVTVVEDRKDAGKLMQREIAKLNQAVARIKNEDEAKNEFIAILAHELRNPLAPIVSSLELMEYEELTEGARHWLRIISDHTKTVRRLLDDLLDISRISQRKLRLRRELMDLRPIVERSRETAEPLFRTRKHRVSLTNTKEPLMIDADPVRIEQILVNLLNNAARYTESGGSIAIATKRHEKEAIISVKDTGIGIAPHMLSRIFDPFVQASAPKQSYAGLGIGLSLTKQLVDMHGGNIEAKSRGIGKGSEFIVHLPLARTMRRSMVPLPTPLTTFFPMPQTYRILIVDDNEAAAEGLSKLLTYRGHETRLIFQGGEVLPCVRNFEPDVILLDIGLPDVDGYDVARRLKAETDSEAILIALTGYGQDEDRQRAKDAGFDYHLTKPVGLRDIENVLTNREAAKL
jgi:signal transduction histidine kinase